MIYFNFTKNFQKSLSRKIKRNIDEITKKLDIQDLTVINFFLKYYYFYNNIKADLIYFDDNNIVIPFEINFNNDIYITKEQDHELHFSNEMINKNYDNNSAAPNAYPGF